MNIEAKLPQIKVSVFEAGGRARRGWVPCEIDKNLNFTAENLASYFFASWEPIIFDAFLLAAAVEFCDRTHRRPSLGWGRDIALSLPVHDPQKWNQQQVLDTLHEALEFLTGDCWHISFIKRQKVAAPPAQGLFNLATGAIGVVPFSEGLDSNAVGALLSKEFGKALVRVRLGKKNSNQPVDEHGRKEPFKAIPYNVRPGEKRFAETSARTRGFKFAMLSGLAAYLAGAKKVFVPESGQGALGPSLVTVGQAYEDFRNHPRFTTKMSAFLKALLNQDVAFEFPRLWYTKGETLTAYAALKGRTPEWGKMRSCWQDNRQVSIGGRRRQCGICAACMLRRLSLHAAKIADPNQNYIWENLSASTFEAGAANGFNKITKVQRQYAIAGTLHLDHLSSLWTTPNYDSKIEAQSYQLSKALGVPQQETQKKLCILLTQHKNEWTEFTDSLGPQSFVTKWLGSKR
jgi:Queuosine biosynthesis protein QueC